MHILIVPSGISLFLQLQQRRNAVNYDSGEKHLAVRLSSAPPEPSLGCTLSLFTDLNWMLSISLGIKSQYKVTLGLETCELLQALIQLSLLPGAPRQQENT